MSTAWRSASLAAGWYHSLAVKSDGTVSAAGNNGVGQLGNNTLNSSSTVVAVSNLTGATAVAGSAYSSLALKADGTVWAWGWNNVGQLGNNSVVDSPVPVPVPVPAVWASLPAAPSWRLPLGR